MTTPNFTTIDDVEAGLQEGSQAQKAADIKLEGDDIPEEFRGKSVAELIQMQKGLADSLKLSEHARMNALSAAPTVPKAPAAPAEEPELTDEQLAELHAEDPVKAIRAMQAQAVRIAQRNLEARVSPLLVGTTSAVENSARTKYAEEFAALGPEIQQIIDGLPNRQILSDPVAWDQIVSYARGQNFEKMMDFKLRKTRSGRAEEVREQQVESVGAVFAPTQSSATTRKAVVMDDYTKEIARNLQMTPEEYIKWSGI